MSAIEVWVRTPWAQALGWALAHSVWQGAAAAMFLAVARGTTQSARARYAAGCLAMALMAGGVGGAWGGSVPPGAASRVGLVPHAPPAARPGAPLPRVPRGGRPLPLLPP